MATAYKTSRMLSGDPAVSAAAYFQRISQLIPKLPFDVIDEIALTLFHAIRQEQVIFVFGNGGSAASASHMMCDLNKNTVDGEEVTRPRVLSLTDNVPLLTAYANDRGYESVFSEQLQSFASRGDVAFAISASGNSPNIIMGLETARSLGAFNIGISGFRGGKMRDLCDLCAVVPAENMQIIEDLHHAMLHSIFTAVRQNLRRSAVKTLTATAGRSGISR